jgi:hypothetical protein
MNELLVIGLQILALVLMIFGIGAISGWQWAVKSLRRRPPAWITGVVAAAGLSSSTAFALQENWLQALGTGGLWLVVVAGQLGVRPFARSRNDAT